MPENSIKGGRPPAPVTPARGRAVEPPDESKFRIGPALADQAVREGFDARGQSIDPESPEVVAKRVRDGSTANVRCFVRVQKSGRGAGLFFNPHNPFESHGTAKSVVPFSWCPVAEDRFESYLLFLKTKNPTHLRQAERI